MEVPLRSLGSLSPRRRHRNAVGTENELEKKSSPSSMGPAAEQAAVRSMHLTSLFDESAPFGTEGFLLHKTIL